MPLFRWITRRSPLATLSPYTTLFRSRRRGGGVAVAVAGDRGQPAAAVGDAAAVPGHLVGRGGVLGADVGAVDPELHARQDRKSTRLNSSHLVISYAVFCLKKKQHKTS